MTLPSDIVAWMFFAIVALAAVAILTNYAIVRTVLTGKAWIFERRHQEHEHGRVLTYERERNG